MKPCTCGIIICLASSLHRCHKSVALALGREVALLSSVPSDPFLDSLRLPFICAHLLTPITYHVNSRQSASDDGHSDMVRNSGEHPSAFHFEFLRSTDGSHIVLMLVSDHYSKMLCLEVINATRAFSCHAAGKKNSGLRYPHLMCFPIKLGDGQGIIHGNVGDSHKNHLWFPRCSRQ